jgi:hypothetical protein
LVLFTSPLAQLFLVKHMFYHSFPTHLNLTFIEDIPSPSTQSSCHTHLKHFYLAHSGSWTLAWSRDNAYLSGIWETNFLRFGRLKHWPGGSTGSNTQICQRLGKSILYNIRQTKLWFYSPYVGPHLGGEAPCKDVHEGRWLYCPYSFFPYRIYPDYPSWF